MSPLRVPIISPSRGVKPMEVSTHLPSFTAETEEPLPRWQMMRRQFFVPRIFAVSCETNLWDVP